MSSKLPVIWRFTAMTVPCELILFASEAKVLAQQIELNMRRLEAKYNFHDEASWLNRIINQRSAPTVVIDPETADILHRVRQCSEITRGVFDITIGTVKRFNAQKIESLSREAVYQQMAPFMGLTAWALSENGAKTSTLTLPYAATQLDLGGVIKECAVDQAIALACQAGATGILVNFGGDIRTLGSKADGSDFIVAVLNPKDTQQPMFALPLVNQSLTTSAHYQRSYAFRDQQTSHILASRGVHPQVLSSTVVADTALEAGIYSTALTIDPTLTLPDNVGFALVDDQLCLHQDSGFINL